MERIVVVGPGRVGLALGEALLHAPGEVELLYMGRDPEPPGHPLFHRGAAGYRHGLERPEPGTTVVVLAVPDDALPEIALALAARGPAPPGCSALHTSGALGADPLEPLHAAGYPVGPLHPLQAIADPFSGAERLPGSAFAVSGEPPALAVARRLVSQLGGTTLSVPTSRRPVYHAAAVLASNYLVVLLHEAVEWLQAAGADPEEAERALVSLARGTLANVDRLGVGRALTGPLLRGDVETVSLHLRSLARDDAELYAALGRRALDWIGEALPPETAARMHEILEKRS